MDEEEKKPRGGGRLLFAGIALFAVLAAYALRLADWQIANHDKWLREADRSGTATAPLEAARGEILDAQGVGLAVNQTGYAIRFNAAYMKEKTENATIHTLIALLDARGEKWVDKLPIRLNSAGKYEFIPGQEKEVSVLKSKDFLAVNPYTTAEQCMQHLIEKYGCEGYSAKDARDIASVRYNMARTWFSLSIPYTFAESVSQDTVAVISENSASLPGVETKVTAVRKYPDGTLLPQILGTVGAISQEEYDALHKTKGYALDDRLGKSGVEKAFEDQLRGKAGELRFNLAQDGSIASETVVKAPVAGNTVHLTIDSRLQKVLNASLAQNVTGAREYGEQLCAQNYKGSRTGHGEDCVAGAAVVLRVKDFAVLAASTYPSYDQNRIAEDAKYYGTLLKDGKTKPLINRAFNGVFTPGSVVKPYVTLAALQEGAITTSTRILANSIYMRFADSHFTPHSLGSYGYVTANFALMKSSNAFFYEVGYRLGITKMNLYARRFGLGVKTGLELGESAGVLAGPEERAASGGSWWDGNTVEAAVGQDDNLFSPLQLATYCATLANKGVRLQPHLLDKITDYAQQKVISSAQPKQAANVGVSDSYQEYVKAAMRSVATGGTAASVFKDYGVAIAAKTGTAELGTNGSDNVTFIGYAPYDDPQIAVAVVLEHGATGKYSMTVAKDLFDAYFFGKTVDSSGRLVMPSASQAAGASSSAG